ncbi:MFS transporter [Microbacterium sp. M]|uniref:MFS transporter n=1 Tax=Microbacterium sp. M TaxID=3377125 RepID=UPI003865ED09
MSRPQIPRGFNAWVATSVGSELGSGVLAFGLTWIASGHGPQVASWVLTLTVAPSVALGLLGGAVADRFGASRVMIFGTSALMIVSGGLAAAVAAWGTPPVLLMVTAALIGTVAAFHRPAVGVFPRLFVADSSVLGAAMARAGMASQLARTIAPPLGGLLIGMIALSGVALIDVLGCVIMLVALLLVHPPLKQAPVAEAVTFRGMVSGIATARTTRGVSALLLCVAIVAGAVIPAVLLGIPLAARERGWTAAEAGLIEAGWIAGGLLSGAWFAWRGTVSKAWRPMAAGPMIVAAGLGLLAVSASSLLAVASTTLIGIGVVVFTAHVFPTYILLAPPTMLSRFQSLLILVQQAPQLIVNPLIGLAVAAVGAGPTLAMSGVIALVASLVVLTDRTLRTSAVDT